MKQRLAELINVIFGFRKFLILLAIFIIGVVFRLKGLVSGGEMVDLFKATTLAFMGANGVEHIVNCVKDNNATKLAMSQADEVVPAEDQEAEDAKAEAEQAGK